MLVVGLSGFALGQTETRSNDRMHSERKMHSDKDNEGWVKIGEKTVDLDENRGIFNWDNDREKTINANEKYSAIKFKAKEAPVNLTNIEVEYADGHKQDLNINSPVKINTESKIATLDDDRKLDKITFNYRKDASASSDKAIVEIWGLRSEVTAGMGTRDQSLSMRSEDDAWIKIGEKTVDLDKDRGIFDWDKDLEKTINTNDRYSAIKFRAEDASVNMDHVILEYTDGSDKHLSIGKPITANSESSIIALDNDKKLDKITFNYKKDGSAEVDKARIEVWGLKAEHSGGMGQRNPSDIDRKERKDRNNRVIYRTDPPKDRNDDNYDYGAVEVKRNK